MVNTDAPLQPVQIEGRWKTLAVRRLDLTARIMSVKGSRRPSTTVAEYQIARIPLEGENFAHAIAAWRFRKTLPSVETYTICLHDNGTLSCDCAYSSYAHDPEESVCAHKAAVVTMAELFAPLVRPLPPPPCPTCQGSRELPNFETGEVAPCPNCRVA